MYSKILTAVNWGIEGKLVEIESNIYSGLPNHVIVGLPSTIIKESKERVKSALKATGFKFPNDRIVQNLYPANLKKEGTQMDLPIAMGIICSALSAEGAVFENYGFLGELSLDGKIQPVSGILSLIEGLSQASVKHIVIPEENFEEAAHIDDVKLYPYSALIELMHDLMGGRLKERNSAPNFIAPLPKYNIDMSEIIGQNAAIRAAQIAAAGFHNLLIIGPPGCGKSMLAERIRTIMAPMDLNQRIEVTKIYGISNEALKGRLVTDRPFRTPHHTISRIGLVGGIIPGEISKAHQGVLYLDELGEFKSDVVDALREPLSTGGIHLTKSGKSLCYPAKFMLIATMNPCPCGNFMSRDNQCTCSQSDIKKYFSRISWPILDRLDMTIYMDRVQDLRKIMQSKHELQGSEKLRASVVAAQPYLKASDKSSSKKIMTKEAESTVLRFHEQGKLSMRSYEKILQVSRTIASLEQSTMIEKKHILEAYSYQTSNQIKRFFE